MNVGYRSIAQVNTRKEIFWRLKSKYQNGNQYFIGCRNVGSYVGADEGWWQSSGQSQGISTSASLPSWYTDFSGIEWKDTYFESGSTTGNIAFGVNQCNRACANLLANGTLNGYLNTFFSAKLGVDFDNTKWDALAGLEGKIIYDEANNLYYRVVVKSKLDQTRFTIYDSDTGGTNLRNFINNNLVRTGLHDHGTLTGNLRSGDIVMTQLRDSTKYLTLEQVVIEVAAVIPRKNSRIHLEDSPYDMFCIPYSDDLQMTDGTDTWTCNKAVAVSIATDIGANSGNANLYDIQILPYCPSMQLVNSTIDPSVLVDISAVPHTTVSTTESTPRKITAIIWCPKSTFSFEVEKPMEGSTFGAPYEVDSTVRYDTYYMMPNYPDLPSGVTRSAVSYIGGNGFDLYKVSKSTGEAVFDTNVKSIEMVKNTTTGVFWLTISKGTFSSSYTYVSINQTDYNNASYYYMIKKNGTGGMGGQYLDHFLSVWKKPTVSDLGTDFSSPERIKMSNDCYLYRLSAGNYSALFEFSPAKSHGYDGYKIDCTYKPYAPWIHVIPKLKGLYGDDFAEIDDARGLICGGDYSLPQLTNAWANYQLNNKTYQDVFDRQMKNMDINNDIARQEQMFASVSGALTGGMGGAVSGALAGAKAGPYGAIAGAVVGGVAGTAMGVAGGVMDYNNLVTRQEEAKSYAKDLFNYSLQNIQAIPTGLAKTSALVANTRIWPFLEIFGCTDREQEAYLDKLEYDGMTIMAIGKIVDFKINTPKFFKGEIIRLQTLNDDAHMANEICVELKKGVYI